MTGCINMLGRVLELPSAPKRIVSLVPSQTELLYDLGLEEAVVGITKFCIHPDAWFRTKTRVGGTKNVNLDRVRLLRPDLIIANKEENTRADIEALSLEFPVWISDIATLADSCRMIEAVGRITGKEEAGKIIAAEVLKRFAALKPFEKPLRAAYLIWKDPWMTVGHDTFIAELLRKTGWRNVFEDRSRYPAVTEDELIAAKPDLLLLSSEPYPFKEKHVQEWQLLLPGTKILLVDGECFSWYGSRLLRTPEYLERLFREVRSINC